MIAAAEIFAEASTSVGKYEVEKKRESLYAWGFLSAFWALIFLVLIAIFKEGSFVFTLSSLPTFISRAVVEIVLTFISLHAVLTADRSTFSFLRIVTIPLLLIVDTALGYRLSFEQYAGIGVLVVTLIFLLMNHGLSAKGKFISLISAVLATATISLYKFDITHYNSVVAEQLLMYIILLVSFIIAAKWYSKENVFKYLLHPIFLGQSLFAGIAGLLASFAYLFAPASVISTARRAFEILISIISGRTFFHEKHLFVKIVSFIFIFIGTILLII